MSAPDLASDIVAALTPAETVGALAELGARLRSVLAERDLAEQERDALRREIEGERMRGDAWQAIAIRYRAGLCDAVISLDLLADGLVLPAEQLRAYARHVAALSRVALTSRSGNIPAPSPAEPGRTSAIPPAPVLPDLTPRCVESEVDSE